MKVSLGQANEFFTRWFNLGGPRELLLKMLGDDDFMVNVLQYGYDAMTPNPYKQTVEETLAALHVQNMADGWGVTSDDFARLRDGAPEWPSGRDAYRSLRVRWGEGSEGVRLTFKRHVEAMQRVHTLQNMLIVDDGWSPTEHLRLRKGDQTHRPVIEWVIIPNLSAHTEHQSVAAVRSPHSLADEGLALAWLFPSRITKANGLAWRGWCCAGYDTTDTKRDSKAWQRTVTVVNNGRMVICRSLSLDDGENYYSVAGTQEVFAD